jgi:Na+/H+ antiporter NhaD/arsenite permease-like protein
MQLTHHRHTPHHHHFHPREFWTALARFVRQNTVLCIAMLAAAVTSLIVPPDAQYLGYFDLKTLSCLFCTLAVVCALKNIYFFTILAQRIVRATGNIRMAVLALVVITFVGSMLIANDMALLTFLPLGYFILSCTGQEKHMAFTFIMQNIAANLGGMLTPFGNRKICIYIPASTFPTVNL